MAPGLLRQAQRLAPIMSPKQVADIDNMLRMGDEAGAAQYMQYIEAALRTDDYVPRNVRRLQGNTAISVPGPRDAIPYTPGKPSPAPSAPTPPQVPPAPVPPPPSPVPPQRRSPKDAAGNSIRQLLSPVRMPNSPLFLSDFPESSVPYSRAPLVGSASERVLADQSLLGDFKKVLGYGAIPGAAVGLAVRSVAERGEDSSGSASGPGGRASEKPLELMTSEEYLQHLRSKGFE